MEIVQELSRRDSNASLVSPTSIRRASIKRVEKLVAEAKSEDFGLKKKEEKKEKNLSMEIKNYQRKTMLNGIDQQEMLDENYELLKLAEAQGVNMQTVSNFKGKEILDSLHDLKIEYDKQYFNRQTYKEFL